MKLASESDDSSKEWSSEDSVDGYTPRTLKDKLRDAPIFEGWMIAASPALNALDHARYDVWVLRCTTSSSGDGNG